MILQTGELFDFQDPPDPPDVLLVSANATITAKGALVMGRGAALQAKTRFPGCDTTFGRIIAYHLLVEGGKPYGVLVIPNTLPKSLGVFQVKWNFRDKASLELIRFSSSVLTRKAEGVWKDKLIWMNFPGIWNGGLSRDVVWPLVKDLPDNVVVWMKNQA
jgi:hypothetical protein